jgi:hypothetical protein
MRYSHEDVAAFSHRADVLAEHAERAWGLHNCPDCGRWCLDLPFCGGVDCEYMNGSITLLPPLPGKEKDA